jgi:hypothetical protein
MAKLQDAIEIALAKVAVKEMLQEKRPDWGMQAEKLQSR